MRQIHQYCISWLETDASLVGELHNYILQRCSEQIALEGQDLPRTYLAHHELESVITSIIINTHAS